MLLGSFSGEAGAGSALMSFAVVLLKAVVLEIFAASFSFTALLSASKAA